MRQLLQGLAVAVGLAWTTAHAAALPQVCVGDCTATDTVDVGGLITLVNIALGNEQPSACLNGIPIGAPVNVALLIQAVNNALSGCPRPAPATSTPTPAMANTLTPTPTASTQPATVGPYEYRLQFTPGAGYHGLVVAGYEFDGSTVVGNCSYYTVHSGSGRGGGYHSIKTYFNQTCRWDLYGNLVSIAPGAPTVPTPRNLSGTQTIYAMNAGGAYTGSDTALAPYYGFVSTPGSHYSWRTSNAHAVLQQAPYTFAATLGSDGDAPLHISAVGASALHGGAVVDGSTCVGEIPAGATCAITVTYDPTHLRSASGLAYDTLDVSVTSDAGQTRDFIQGYTIVLSSTGED